MSTTRIPFRQGTRRRVQSIGAFPVTPGQPVQTITLPQVGMVSRVLLSLEGTITLSAAGVQNALGYAALLSRVRLSANLGSASIVDCTGIGLELVNQWRAPQTKGRVQNAFGNGAVANEVIYRTAVPVNANNRQQFEFGLIDLQSPEVRVTLDVSAADLSAFTTNATASSLTLYVAYEYWEIPDPSVYELPPMTLVRTIEDAALPIAVLGDQTYQIPRLGTLIQMSNLVLLNGAPCQLTGPTPDVSEIRMRINKTDTVLDYQTRFKEIEEAEFYNQPSASFMRDGVLTWDFWHASSAERCGGDGRDFFDTESVTTLESIITLSPTAVIAGVSQIQPVRRVLQRIV